MKISTMEFDNNDIKAVLFDFGNTLIEFTCQQLKHCDSAMAAVLKRWYGFVDFEQLTQERNTDRMAPYQGDFRENDLITITKNLVQSLYKKQPPDELVKELLQTRFEAFVSTIAPPEYLYGFLEGLAKGFRLGLLSNYPCGEAIRASLQQLGINHFFQSVVVSGDIGYVKPHPLVFETITIDLQVEPDQCLFIGDNWLGDIQGAKRAGMRAIHTIQFDSPEKFEPQSEDYLPDCTVHHLLEVEGLLGVGC